MICLSFWTESPNGQYCYGNLQCIPVTVKPAESASTSAGGAAINNAMTQSGPQGPQIKGGPKWCGKTFEDTTCPKECPDGTDAECAEDEQCFNESPCQYLGTSRWCGKDFEDKTCSKECPDGASSSTKWDIAIFVFLLHYLINILYPNLCIGTDEECDEGEQCFGNSPCQVKEVPAPTPEEDDGTTDPPTSNPGQYYCSLEWRGSDYNEECGRPCPR